MGYNLYITRAEFWAENEDNPISADEWLAVVKKDPSLNLDLNNGAYHTIWNNQEESWLDWTDGNIYAKYPDEKLIGKMHEIALMLGAEVHGEENEAYVPGQKAYHSHNKPNVILIDPKKLRLLKFAELLSIFVTLVGCLSVVFGKDNTFNYRHIIIAFGVIGMLATFLVEHKTWFIRYKNNI